MRCIFCKTDSSHSRSIEHIIPESLGNTEHVLPRGVVCDQCNNYFARKIEGPLLESMWLRHARSRQQIANKRGLIPPLSAIIPGARMKANVWMDGSSITFQASNQGKQCQLVEALMNGRANSLYIPMPNAIEERLMARFLAKIAIEILVSRVFKAEGWETNIIDEPQLDELRRFARVGDQSTSWPYSRRRIYGENDVQLEHGADYQILHEFTLLYKNQNELFAIVCIFGEEFAINCAGPAIDGYKDWLSEHGNKSPLYISDELPLKRLGGFGGLFGDD